MNPFKNIWNKFITQPDIWFFYGFLLTFTLSARKVIKFYPINSQFNEYTGIYLYLSDIFLILTLVLWGILILQNKKEYLSNIKLYLALNKPLIKLLLIFNLWVFVSIFWSGNQYIALFRSIKILEFSLLFLYVAVRIVPYGTIQMLSPFIKGRFREGFLKSTKNAKISLIPPFTKGEIQNVPRGTFLKNIFQIIIFLGLFQAIIGIWQFILQHSVGLFWLKESIISPEIPGVAKIIINGEKFIRAYGLFPHPNILGGFLLLSIILTFVYYKYHSERSGAESKNLIIRSLDKLGMTIITIQFIALLLTFSKSAIIGLIISFGYILYANVSHLPSETKMFHKEHFSFLRGGISFLITAKHYWRQIVITVLIAFIGLSWLKLDWNTFFIKSWIEREVYLIASFKKINDSPVAGAGMGQFVLVMGQYVPHGTYLENWQFQPVHNVFLLILSELGIIGLGLFIWWTWRLLKLSPFLKGRIKEGFLYSNSTQKSPLNPPFTKGEKQSVPRGTLLLTIILKSVLIGFIFIMLLDHYFWDIQQGEILFWLITGLLVGINSTEKTDLEK